MYEIKEFYGKETLRFKEICCELFRYADEGFENREEYEKKLIEADNKRKEGFIRMGAFEDGNLFAGMELHPYEINFDGKVMKMAGIGSVVSSQASRKKGAIKAIFKELFKVMRENEQYISHLYPFNANYYRQYGYDVSCNHCQWSIPIEYIPEYMGKNVFYDGSEKMKKEIKEIYEKFSSNYNMAIVKDSKRWDDFFKNIRPYVTKTFSYVHYTKDCADAFMLYSINENQTHPQDFSVRTLWFSSFEGLKGVLSYFVTQRPYGDRVYIKLPCDIDLSAAIEILGGWGKRNVDISTIIDGTTRVVDVAEVLKRAKCKGCGSVGIKIVNDEYCPWNNGIYTLQFGDKNTVSRGENADIEMDINAFSSLIMGRCELNRAGIFANLKIFGNEEELKKVFYKKCCYIEEHF